MDNERNYNSAKEGGSITALFIIVIAPKVMEFPQINRQAWSEACMETNYYSTQLNTSNSPNYEFTYY